MAVFLSPVGGAAAQFFDNNGIPLAGGLIYTYSAGTSTPSATYTTSNGLIQHSNPIILDAAGRVPTGEIWLSDGIAYKFVIKTAQDVLVATYDNIVGINSNFVAYTSQQEIQTATAGQTVFTLATMQYQPGTNNLSVFVDGVNQYGPGAQYAFTETDSETVTFVTGLHVGASVKFTTASPVSSAVANAENVAYTPPFAGSVTTNVEVKLSEWLSVKDFGAVGDGVTDDTDAIQAAIDAANNGTLYFPTGIYSVSTLDTGTSYSATWYCGQAWLKANADSATDCVLRFQGGLCNIYGLKFDMNFNTNYASALWWYNSVTPSQYNNFFGLQIVHAITGVVFGEFPGSSTGSLAQSEDSFFGFQTRGVQKPIIMNHANGFLSVNGSQVAAQNEEWEANAPGVFDYTDNHVIEAYAGNLFISNSEIQNSVADTASTGIYIQGGSVMLDGCTWETDVPAEVSGTLLITGGSSFNTQSVTSQFYIDPTASSSTILRVSDFRMFRAPTVGSFSAVPLVANAGSSNLIQITFTNCAIEEWADFVQLESGNAQSVNFSGCRWYPDGTQNPYYNVFKIDTISQDLLSSKYTIDTEGWTTDGFYLHNLYGAGTTDGVEANVPTYGNYTNSMYVSATGLAGMFTTDPTSLSTIKDTAIRCNQYDSFIAEGWIKLTTGTAGALGAAIFDSTGSLVGGTFTPIVDQDDGVSSIWKYFRQVIVMPANAAYVGFGCYGLVSKVNLVGLKVRKSNWNTY